MQYTSAVRWVTRVATAVATAVTLVAPHATSECLPPGFLLDPDGLQRNSTAVYNSAADEYLVTYVGEVGLGATLSPDGALGAERLLSTDVRPDQQVFEARSTYAPDRNEYLFVWRQGDPNQIFARYLDGQANPIGDPIGIVTGAARGTGAYAESRTGHDQYLVLWSSGAEQAVRFRTVSADSAAAPLVGAPTDVVTGAVAGRVAYGAAADQYLVVYVRDFAPSPDRADLFGRFVSGDGSVVGPEIDIARGPTDQSSPLVAYSAVQDRFLVMYAEFKDVATNNGDVYAVFVDNDGTVSPGFPVADTAGDPDTSWDSPSALGYNPVTDTFLAAWFLVDAAYAREIHAADGALGSVIVVCDENENSVTSIAARSRAEGPQFLAVWRQRLNTVGAGIVELDGVPSPDAGAGGTAMDGGMDASTAGTGGAGSPGTAGDGAGGTGFGPRPESKSGCGCRVARAGGSAWRAGFALLLVLRRRKG